MADNVGLYCGSTSGKVFMVINPDSDSELDKPCWLQLGVEGGESVEVVKMPMTAYRACRSPADIQAFATRALRRG